MLQERLKTARCCPVMVPEMVTSNSSVTALGNSIRWTNSQLLAWIDIDDGIAVAVGVGGTGVTVGGTGVIVGGTGVAVEGTGVGVGATTRISAV
jgi:hypothetical protein